MTVWRELDAVPSDLGRTVVTIGNFDGVHRGHRLILDHARRTADALEAQAPAADVPGADVPVVVVTFDPHPVAVLAPERAPAALTTMEQKISLLAERGDDHVLVLPFDSDMAAWTPEEFVRRVLVDTLHAAAVVVGTNFRFGHRAAGDVDTLRTLGNARGNATGDAPGGAPGQAPGQAPREAPGVDAGFTVEGLDLAGGEPPWSSTLVRQALAEGDVAAAAETLGRPHTVSGVVVEGDHRGRELGYPTANVPTSGLLAVPADGVYAGTLQRVDDPGAPVWPAAVSVGTNPTFDGVERRVESYVLDRDDLELYGVPVRVAFHARLRGQVRFEGIEALVEQMADDVDSTRVALGRQPGSRPG